MPEAPDAILLASIAITLHGSLARPQERKVLECLLKDWHLKREEVLNSANQHSFEVMLTLLGLFLRHHQVFICVYRGRMRRQLG